ncbi:twin-arginine translocation signal domain-containing protein [Kribbella sp. NPDC026611]|uniref:twin-arginine translocation signal domain-containing protein n=1 Tax=Kribbella sp. NPDC026611 TaxID=3154911 RepID=UPI0033E6BAB7
MVRATTLSRRAFLARVGILGAAVGGGGLLARSLLAPADAATNPLLPPAVDLIKPVLAELARDTLNGLTVFAMPGPDAYSRTQGTPSPTPGAIEAGATDFIINSLDNFVPFPDELAQPIGAALVSGLADSGIDLPGIDVLPVKLHTLDQALAAYLQSDEALPLSFPIAGLLNLMATQVNPLAVNGPHLSPFARLSYAEKARAFELIEQTDADLVALLDVHFPEPLKDSVSGLLKFVGGALIEFATFGAYGESAVYDKVTRTLGKRPVGWNQTGYQPHGPVEGWDDFIGYYQGRQEVHD